MSWAWKKFYNLRARIYASQCDIIYGKEAWAFIWERGIFRINTVGPLSVIVPHSTDTQSLARDTQYCARSTLDIMVQVR